MKISLLGILEKREVFKLPIQNKIKIFKTFRKEAQQILIINKTRKKRKRKKKKLINSQNNYMNAESKGNI